MKASMKPKLENLLPIDWELGKKLAGNKADLAEDILSLLIKNLPTDLHHIKELYDTKHYQELLKHIHKLHGALSYCGTPRLKMVIACIETDLKNNIMDNLLSFLNQLDIEVNRLLEHYYQTAAS